MYKGFQEDVARMNAMFELPVKQSIELDKYLAATLYKLHNTLTDEVNELLNITKALDVPEYISGEPYYPSVNIDHYVDLAELLGNLVIRCTSEAIKHGIYLPEVLKPILDAKDEAGNDPKEAIKRLLQARNRMVACSKNVQVSDQVNTELPTGYAERLLDTKGKHD